MHAFKHDVADGAQSVCSTAANHLVPILRREVCRPHRRHLCSHMIQRQAPPLASSPPLVLLPFFLPPLHLPWRPSSLHPLLAFRLLAPSSPLPLVVLLQGNPEVSSSVHPAQ